MLAFFGECVCVTNESVPGRQYPDIRPGDYKAQAAHIEEEFYYVNQKFVDFRRPPTVCSIRWLHISTQIVRNTYQQ